MTLVPPRTESLPAAAPGASVARPPSPPAPGILSLGSHVPEGVMTNADLERMVDTSDSWILERTGIRERRVAGSGETASVMGAAAAKQALERAGNPGIDGIVVATASPDTLFPSTACLIQRRLGLGGIPAFDIGAACSGFLYALTMAESLIRCERGERWLVVGTEAMTSLVDFGDRSTCVLFGDGAGAAVVGVGAGGGIRASHWGADGSEADLIFYGADDAHQGEHIRMHGKGTFRLAVERMVESARRVVDGAGWSIDDVDLVVPHQANVRIIDAVAKRLGVGEEKVVVTGDRLGNSSAASIPLALAEAQAGGRLRRGDRVVCLAFGSGSTWGGVAVEWSCGPDATGA